MRVFRTLLFLGLLALPSLAHAQYNTGAEVLADLTINQTTSWVALVDSFRAGFYFDIDAASAAHCIYVVEADTQPANGLTSAGRRFCRKSGQPDFTGNEWISSQQRWYGKLWVRAEDTGVILHRVRW